MTFAWNIQNYWFNKERLPELGGRNKDNKTSHTNETHIAYVVGYQITGCI